VCRTKWPAPWSNLLGGSFVLASLALLAWPLAPQVFGAGKTMDYPLWYVVGSRVWQGGPVYYIEPRLGLDFLYTPFAALALTIPAYFGRTAMVAILAVTTLACWWIAIGLSNRLAGDTDRVSPWVATLPIVATLPFVYEQFHIGQPNLLLLALMLTGFFLLRRGREGLAGIPFATAAAIKAFPVMILPYLIWRRRWRATSIMLATMVLLLLVLPGSLRGFERNWSELTFWVKEMLLSNESMEFAQRHDTFGWQNQSLYAVTHRLVRPINAELFQNEDGAVQPPPIYVNLLNLDYRTADIVFLAVAVAIGLAFIALLPARDRRTPRSDAAEWSIVLLLIVLASPVSRPYYYVWLLCPWTVLARIWAAETNPTVARWTAVAGAVSALMFASGINDVQPRYTQAAGVHVWATLLVIATLAVHMRRAARPVEAAQRPVTS
jgi:hypothetical protein